MTETELKNIMPKLKVLSPPLQKAPNIVPVSHVPKDQNPHYLSCGRRSDFYV